MQEHRAQGAKLEDLKTRVRKDGWDGAFSPAQPTTENDDGFSGGTAIVVRKGLTLTDVQGLPAEVGWPPGHRISLRLLNAIAPGGLLVGSVYLTAGKGYTGPNIQFSTC